MARKKKALPKIPKINVTTETNVSVNVPGMESLIEGVSVLGETINGLTETTDLGLQENNAALRQVDATLVRQSGILEKGFGQNLKMGSRLLALQEKLSEEEARRRVADEEAAMERVNQGSLLDVQKTLEEIKDLLDKEGAARRADAARKDGGIMSSLANLLGIGAAGMAAKGVLSRIPGVNRLPGMKPGVPSVPTTTPTAAPPITGRAPVPSVPPGAPGVPGAAGGAGAPGAPGGAGAPGAATPAGKPPVTPPPPMTPEQKVKYEELRKQGVPAAEAKAQATTKPGFEGYTEKEKRIMEAAGKKMPEPPTKVPTPPVSAPAEAAQSAAKKGMLGRAASMGGKALKFIPGVGWAVAAGTALYQTGEAAYNAEETLGIKGREATTGERVAAGAGGLTSALTFGLISKETAGRFYKGVGEGFTGAPTNKPLPSVTPASNLPPAPPPGGTAAAAPVAVPPSTTPPVTPPAPPAPTAATPAAGPGLAPSGEAAATRSLKPRISISGQDDIKNMIKRHEGFVPHPYKDSLGLWTIGYGHLIGNGKTLPPEWNRTITRAEGDALFEEDYAHHRKAAERIPGFEDLNMKGQGALTDLTFNMGPAWYTKWPTLQKQLKAGDVDGAADNLQSSKWFQQVKTRGPTIVSLVREGKDKQATPTAAATPSTPPPPKPDIPAEKPTAATKPTATSPQPTPVMTESGGVLTSSSGEPVMSGASPEEATAPMAAPPVVPTPATKPAVSAPPAAQPMPKPFSGRGVMEASAGGAAATAGVVMQAMAPAKGAAVQNMSERVAAVPPPAPIVVSTPSVDTQHGGAAKPGSNGIPDPYANRGSLTMNTTFIAAA